MMILALVALLAQAPSAPVHEMSGESLWRAHCASCHGMDGKGGGPVVKSLKKPAPDLTQLSKRSGGKFPAERVERAILNGDGTAVHGTREMPVWGPAFSELENDRDLSRVRVRNLSNFLAGLQKK